MKIIDLLKNEKVCISCELFPPKAGTELQNALNIVSDIAEVGPHFMSVTYGAGGTSVGQTVAIARAIEASGRPALAHLTCIDADEAKIDGVLAQMRAAGVQNVLALRGDAVNGNDGDFAHASDLMGKIKKAGDFCVGGACYPEGHPESSNKSVDMDYLKQKVDAGCDFVTTQMFFDNSVLYSFLYRILAKDIQVPVIAGVMPVTNGRQIQRICQLSGTSLPSRFRSIVDRFGDNPAAMKQAGIAYATEQIIDLIANGVRGIHVYTMNKPDVAASIRANLSAIVGQ